VGNTNLSKAFTLDFVAQLQIEVLSILTSMCLNDLEAILDRPLFTFFNDSGADTFTLKIGVDAHLSELQPCGIKLFKHGYSDQIFSISNSDYDLTFFLGKIFIKQVHPQRFSKH
jgi:hypothetical protein